MVLLERMRCCWYLKRGGVVTGSGVCRKSISVLLMLFLMASIESSCVNMYVIVSNLVCKSCMVGALMIKSVSSAKQVVWANVANVLSMGLYPMFQRMGPRTDPCGTPFSGECDVVL